MLRGPSINKQIATQVIFGIFIIGVVLFCGNASHHFSVGDLGTINLMSATTDTTMMDCCTTSVALPPATILRSTPEIQFFNALSGVSAWYFSVSLLAIGLLLGLRKLYYIRSYYPLKWPRHHLVEALAQGIINPRLYQ